jgi:transcriptional regulator with XRE-family HTH domain
MSCRAVRPEDPDAVIDHVAKRIVELRVQAGMTQAQVAERVGSTVSNYQRIEHGLQNVTVRMMVRVAGAIGVRTAELFEPLRAPKRARTVGRPSKKKS